MATGTSVKIMVSPDRMKATLRINAQMDPKSITRGHILAAIEESKIAADKEVDARLDALCEQLKAGSLPDGDVLLAEGRLPTEPVDAQFTWSEALQPRDNGEEGQGGRVNHYDRNAFVSVRMGDLIGRVTPAVPGEVGVDVHGNAVQPARKPAQVQLKGNVEWDRDGLGIVASSDGRVIFEDNRVSVASVLEVAGDVDFSTGHIDTPGDVTIHGSVKDLFKVRSSRNIEIDWHVDGAVLEAGGDIIIRGGIHGHGKANITAAGRVEAKLCDGASLEAGTMLSVQRECINCRIRAGRISSPAGTIIAGYAWARNGVEIQTLGSPAGVKTVVSVGIPVAVIEQAIEMVSQTKERLDGAKKIRETITPLLREMRRLSPAQRERATELMFQADTLEQQAEQIDTQREEQIRQNSPDVEAGVLVGGRIYPGVTIVVSGRCTVIDKEMRGPVRILERKINGVTTLVAVDTISGSVRPLPTARFTAEAEKEAMESTEECLAGAA